MKHLLNSSLLLPTLLALLIIGCKDKPSPYGCEKSIWDESPNPPMTFTLASDAGLYKKMALDMTKDTLRLGYYNTLISYQTDTGKTFVSYAMVTVPQANTRKDYFISSGELLWLSYHKGVKRFYLNWPSGDLDTLDADFFEDLSRDNSCCCQYPLRLLQLNGKTYSEKKSFDRYGIYRFE